MSAATTVAPSPLTPGSVVPSRRAVRLCAPFVIPSVHSVEALPSAPVVAAPVLAAPVLPAAPVAAPVVHAPVVAAPVRAASPGTIGETTSIRVRQPGQHQSASARTQSQQ